jgi:hypothetical protein
VIEGKVGSKLSAGHTPVGQGAGLYTARLQLRLRLRLRHFCCDTFALSGKCGLMANGVNGQIEARNKADY